MKPAQIVHVGRNFARTKPDRDNPLEAAFANQWCAENNVGCQTKSLLDHLMDRCADQQTAGDVATVIQWLGSPVGLNFLRTALRDGGYEIVRRSK